MNLSSSPLVLRQGDSETWEVCVWGRNLTDEGGYIDYLRDFFGSLSGIFRTDNSSQAITTKTTALITAPAGKP